MRYDVTYYPKFEEKLNVISHGIGVLLSFVAFPFMVHKASNTNSAIVMLSIVLYGVSLIVLYTASTLYHSARKKKHRYYFNIFDHSAIYVLIAGTYAPVALIVLQGTLGWFIFAFSWLFAILGVLYKVFFIGRYRIVSITTYIAMGWMIIFAVKPLMENFSEEGLSVFVLGGISYSLGALFFVLNKIPYNHVIFHLFVLAGSICHFIGVYYYIL